VDDVEYASIDRELHIKASPEVVFEVLSSPEHIRDWWSADTKFEPVAGAASTLTWTDVETGRQEATAFTLVEVDPPRRFSFRWTYDGAAAAPDNSLLVTFDLIPSEQGTTVRFSETGYRERGWEVAVLEQQYNDHRQGWDFYLPRLAATATEVAAVR
jgi:uncharacterized protein YndB with AHSA1/START domain